MATAGANLPPYWAASLFVIAVYLAVPAYRHGGEWIGLPDALLRFGGRAGFGADGRLVAFLRNPLLRALRHPDPEQAGRLAAFALWFALCVAIPDATYLTSTFNLLFAMGLAAASAVRRHKIPWPTFFFWGGIAAFLPSLSGRNIAAVEPGAPPLLYGIGPALFLLGAVELERSRGWRAPRPLTLLGDASYSLYLVHYLVVSAVVKTISVVAEGGCLPRLRRRLDPRLLAVHFLFEKPMLATLGRGSRPPRTA